MTDFSSCKCSTFLFYGLLLPDTGCFDSSYITEQSYRSLRREKTENESIKTKHCVLGAVSSHGWADPCRGGGCGGGFAPLCMLSVSMPFALFTNKSCHRGKGGGIKEKVCSYFLLIGCTDASCIGSDVALEGSY